MFPIGGGRVLAHQSTDFKDVKTAIGYHDQSKPENSPLKICLCDQVGMPIGKDAEYKESASSQIRRHKRQNTFEEPFGKNVPSDLILPKILGNNYLF